MDDEEQDDEEQDDGNIRSDLMTFEIYIVVAVFAFIMEIIDAGLGMGYGTVLSPLLIAMGFPPLVVVPSILISQAVGGLTASVFHQKFRNVDYRPNITSIAEIRKIMRKDGYVDAVRKVFSRDDKIVLIVTVMGVLAAVIGAFAAVKLPTEILKAYIGLLVLLIGIVMLLNRTFRFSWKRMLGLGLLASFNKGISGGGFGPVVTGGQVIIGNKDKSSIGCTTLAEAPICIAAFLMFILMKGVPDLSLAIALSVGGACGAPLGALVTKSIKSGLLKFILALVITALGAAVLLLSLSP